MKKTTLMLTAIFSLSGFAHAAQPYPDMIKSVFVNNCSKADASDAPMCQCIINGVEKTVPVETFISDLQKYNNDIWKQAGYVEVHTACKAK